MNDDIRSGEFSLQKGPVPDVAFDFLKARMALNSVQDIFPKQVEVDDFDPIALLQKLGD